jgi:DNA-binding transcriptional LysR family regulator
VLRLSNVEHQKLLTPVTREFIRRYPDIEIEYIIHPNHSGEYRVIHGIMDIAETFHDPDENALEKIIASGASYTPLTNFPFVAVVSLEHAISTKEKLSLEELVPYETSYFPMITRPVLIQRLKEAFSSAPEHLHSISDIDKQISMTYTVLRKNGILVTCNPYVYYLKDVRILPLDVPQTQEYGILMSDKPSRIAVLYRNLAVQMFRNAWGTHTRLPGTMPL